MHPNPRRGPGRPPAAKSGETRGRIIATARQVFAEVGYEAATFQEIALRAGLTRPAINHYFPNKIALYHRVVQNTSQMVVDAGLDEAGRESTFAGRMRGFIKAAQQAQERDGSVAAFLVTSVLDTQRHPELGYDNDPLQATRRFVRWAVDEAKSAGELHEAFDAEAAVETVIALLLGLGFYAGFVGPERVPTIVEHFLALIRGHGFLQTA